VKYIYPKNDLLGTISSTKKMSVRIVIGILCFLSCNAALGDEIRPGYLELIEKNEHVFSVVWKVPAKGNKKLSLDVQFPVNCKNKTQPRALIIEGAYLQRWIVKCESGLVDKTISISGLQATNTDVLLRIEFLNNTSQSIQLTPAHPTFHIPATASSLQITNTYTWLGIEHILLGIDHLLFVFSLLLIVSGKRLLLWTITAFTIAHSISLAGATLGFVHVPQQPVEAVIALSILFLAVEIMYTQQGTYSIAAKWPWLVAFIFGLLHGFGFAGALTEVGLPQHAIPLALIFFNIGVELGQLLFVAVVLILAWLIYRLNQLKVMGWVKTAAVYSIGGISSFWLLERIYAF